LTDSLGKDIDRQTPAWGYLKVGKEEEEKEE